MGWESISSRIRFEISCMLTYAVGETHASPLRVLRSPVFAADNPLTSTQNGDA